MKNSPRKIKKTLFFSILLSCSILYAQDFSFGIKGGVNLNSIGEMYHYGVESGMGGNGIRPYEDTIYLGNQDLGFQVGAFVMFEYEKFYIRPEFVYSRLNNNYALDLNNIEWKSIEFNVPILFGYKFFGPFSVYGGPSFSYVTDREFDTKDKPYTWNNSSMNFVVGVLGLSGPVGIDIRYQYGLSVVEMQRLDMSDDHFGTNIADLLEYHPWQVMVSLNITLLDLTRRTHSRGLKTGWRNHKNL